MQVGLGMIRVLVGLKAAARWVLRMCARPVVALWKFALPRVVVPAYHGVYVVQRRLEHWYRPAKNRFMYLVANRHTLHTVAIGIAVTAGMVNLQLDDVRAETYGERSIMYGFVTDSTETLVDAYATTTEAVVQSNPTKYMESGVLSASQALMAENVPLEATKLVGSGALSSLTLAEGGVSVAPRDSVETYTVLEGDTLSTIAAKFGVSLNTLLWANSLNVRTIVKPGQELTILPVSGVLHTVRSGETVARIAKTYGVTEDDILAYNNIDDASGLQVSAKVIVPGGEITAPTPVSRTTAVKSIFTSTPTTSAAKVDTGATKMLWPTDLTYVVRGLQWGHTGVDIDCSGRANGTSTNDNYAASDGIVQFAGWKNGYGNTVEINHGNGIVTRYGHHYSIYVTNGQSVTRGTPLGRCGSTGESTGTHLHFEVIANGKFMNPFDYIR